MAWCVLHQSRLWFGLKEERSAPSFFLASLDESSRHLMPGEAVGILLTLRAEGQSMTVSPALFSVPGVVFVVLLRSSGCFAPSEHPVDLLLVCAATMAPAAREEGLKL